MEASVLAGSDVAYVLIPVMQTVKLERNYECFSEKTKYVSP